MSNTPDRLAEVKHRHDNGFIAGRHDHHEDVSWLIAEVERLRKSLLIADRAVEAIKWFRGDWERLRDAMGAADLAIQECHGYDPAMTDQCKCGLSKAAEILHAALIEQKS